MIKYEINIRNVTPENEIMLKCSLPFIMFDNKFITHQSDKRPIKYESIFRFRLMKKYIKNKVTPMEKKSFPINVAAPAV